MDIPQDILLYPPLAGVSLPRQSYEKLLIYTDWAQVIAPITVSPSGEVIFVPSEMYPGTLVTPPDVRSEVLAPSPSINDLLVGKSIIVDNIAGVLLEKNNESITMIAENGQILNWTKPTYMESVNRVYYSKFHRIILIPDNRIQTEGTLSFLMGGLSWKAVAVGQIKDNILKMRFRADITNNTEHSFTSDQLIVVSGGPKGPEDVREILMRQNMYASQSADRLGGISFKETPDTVKYNIKPTVIGKGNIQVELGRIEVNMEMFYHNHLGENSAGTAIRFKPEHHIPQGTFYLYSSEGYYIGSAPLPRAHRGETVNLKIGSHSLPVHSTVHKNQISKDIEEETWNIKLNNPTHNNNKFIISHPFPEKLDAVHPKPTSVDNGVMEWHYNVPPGETTSTIKLRSYKSN